jgi:hypothetical protein
VNAAGRIAKASITSRNFVEDVLIDQVSACLGKRHHPAAQLLEAKLGEMASERLANYLATSAARTSANLVQQRLEVVI